MSESNAPSANPRKRKYKILRGKHFVGGGYKIDEKGQYVRDANGNRVKAPLVAYGPGCKAGTVVETEQDLLKLNKGREIKVALVDDPNLSSYPTRERPPEDPEVAALNAYTVEQLKFLAEEEGIDLGNAGRKSDIIAVIKQARELQPA